MNEITFLKRKIFLKRQAIFLLREEIRGLRTQVAELESRKVSEPMVQEKGGPGFSAGKGVMAESSVPGGLDAATD